MVDRCPKCGSWNIMVKDSRAQSYGRTRRRECRDCGERYTTVEITQKELAAKDNEIRRLKDAIERMMKWGERAIGGKEDD